MVKETLIRKATKLFFEIERAKARRPHVPAIWHEGVCRWIDKNEARLNGYLAPMNGDDLEEYLRRTQAGIDALPEGEN